MQAKKRTAGLPERFYKHTKEDEMKAVKLGMIIAVAALMTLGFGSAAFALHSGGVAHCDACHTMHNSQNGVVYAQHDFPTPGVVGETATPSLLTGTDPSSTCLYCHDGAASYHVLSTDGSNYKAGGDFYWLTVDGTLGRHPVAGEQKGHNIVAADFGLAADVTLTAAPVRANYGGAVAYPSSVLGCESCHDPHGKNADGLPIAESGSYGAVAPTGAAVGNYRLLGSTNYDAGSGVVFDNPSPIAVSAGSSAPDTDAEHNDYGYGMSEWCTNCHMGFDAQGSNAHRHPAGNDAHLNGYGDAYNQYRATGNVLPAPQPADAFDFFVPFERGLTDVTSLSTTRTDGPDINSNIMCLTCHRAHASPFADAGRWDFGEELLDESPIAEEFGDIVWYGEDIATRYGPYQRSLCNKCHIQD